MTRTKIAIHGAAGRMGKRLIALAAADSELEIVSALEYSGHSQFGSDAGVAAGVEALGIPLSDQWSDEVESVIDFSLPVAAESITRACRERRVPLVMATTGLSEEQKQLVRDASADIPIVWAPNMSLAVNLTMNLTRAASKALKDLAGGADVEIVERHHRYKEDAPSGTALRFGEIVAEEMGQEQHTHGRHGDLGQRPTSEIGYHALRVGDNPGEHTIVFGMLGETIELTVRATNRDCYAMGALAAAKFVVGKSPGIYGMNDVLGY